MGKCASILQKYTEKISVEVNKTHESLLIVDDDNLTRSIFKKIFENDFNIIEAKNGAEAVELIEKNIAHEDAGQTENIVGMFLDLKMPMMDGFGVLDYLNNKRIISRIPVIIISADDAKETKEEVYKYEIADMLEKPFNYELIKKRVNNMVRMYAKSNVLNNLVQSQHTNLKTIIKAYVNSYLVDYSAVNELVNKYGKKLLDKYILENDLKDDSQMIISASKYFDVALDLVPRKYLDKIKNLTEEERDIVVNYPNIGAEIITCVADNQSDAFVKYAETITKMRNERYDGMGFPSGLKEDGIPYYVYLINIAIEYANYILSHSSINIEEVKTMILSKSGSKYDPKAVDAFINMIGELR